MQLFPGLPSFLQPKFLDYSQMMFENWYTFCEHSPKLAYKRAVGESKILLFLLQKEESRMNFKEKFLTHSATSFQKSSFRHSGELKFDFVRLRDEESLANQYRCD